MATSWEIVQEANILPKLDYPVFIEGLPGIGNVGKLAVDFLIEEFKAKKLYSFFSYKFPHSVFVNPENLVEMPKLEIYYKRFTSKNGKKKDILLLTGDIQPIDEESTYSFSEEVLNVAKLFRCSEMITTGGIGLQEIPDEPKIFCTSNDEKTYQSYTKKGSGVEKDIFGVVGPIIGVSGTLLGLGKRRNVNGVALLAETFGHPLYLGIKGAKEILRVLEKRFKWGIDLEKMGKEIVEIEMELMKKTTEWATEISSSHQAGAKLKSHDVSYIG